MKTLKSDEIFENKIKNVKRVTQCGFKAVVDNFLGNKKHIDFRNIVKDMLEKFQDIGL